MGIVTLLGALLWGTFSTSGLRVKTLDYHGLDDGDAFRRYPLGGVVVECRVIRCLRWQV